MPDTGVSQPIEATQTAYRRIGFIIKHNSVR